MSIVITYKRTKRSTFEIKKEVFEKPRRKCTGFPEPFCKKADEARDAQSTTMTLKVRLNAIHYGQPRHIFLQGNETALAAAMAGFLAPGPGRAPVCVS
jgi:hypothetical protein